MPLFCPISVQEPLWPASIRWTSPSRLIWPASRSASLASTARAGDRWQIAEDKVSPLNLWGLHGAGAERHRCDHKGYFIASYAAQLAAELGIRNSKRGLHSLPTFRLLLTAWRDSTMQLVFPVSPSPPPCWPMGTGTARTEHTCVMCACLPLLEIRFAVLHGPAWSERASHQPRSVTPEYGLSGCPQGYIWFLLLLGGVACALFVYCTMEDIQSFAKVLQHRIIWCISPPDRLRVGCVGHARSCCCAAVLVSS